MDNENKLKRKLKFYHIFILGCILAIFLMVNSNNVNKRRIADKLDKKQGELFNKIIYGRKLDEDTPGDGGNPGPITPEEGEEEYVFETDVVCQRASEELRNYYNNTATLADLDISEGGISCEDKDKDYIKALISLVKSLIDGGDGSSNDDDGDGDDVDNQNSNGNNNNENNNPENEGDGGNTGSGLSNLISLDGDTKNNLITYGKSMLPVLIALVLSILCIFGWIICCFCNCCNCCCCCCCKKPGCKIPCFLFTYVFYALVVAVCIYGLTQTNKIFVGLANTECSLLRFFDEILFGEMKTTTPRWAGIEGINSILSELKDVISNMGRSTYQTLESGMENIADEEEAFELNLKNAGTEFYDNGNYKIGTFSKDYTSEGKYIKVSQGSYSRDIELKGIYALDIISQFGRYVQGEGESSGHYEPEQSVQYGANANINVALPSSVTSGHSVVYEAENLPEGLSLNANGNITGHSTALGTYNVVVRAIIDNYILRSAVLKLTIAPNTTSEVGASFSQAIQLWNVGDTYSSGNTVRSVQDPVFNLPEGFTVITVSAEEATEERPAGTYIVGTFAQPGDYVISFTQTFVTVNSRNKQTTRTSSFAVAVSVTGEAAPAPVVHGGIVSSEINNEGHLVIKYEDGAIVDLGLVVGADGKDGAQGPAGEKGADGKDGANGQDGAQGPQGEQGPVGPQGPAGENGKDGVSPQGCGGSIAAASGLMALIAGLGLAVVSVKKSSKKED